MRNKDLFQQKLERFEAEVKKMGYYIHRDEQEVAYAKVKELLEKISDMQTLLNTEHQD
jgi:2'-5' RNA ligase